MKLKLKTIILGASALALACLGSGPAWAQPRETSSFKVAARNDGYLLHVTSNLIKNLPAGATLEITLDDPKHGKTTVRGAVSKLSDTSFTIKTNQRFKYQPSGETRVLMKQSGRRPIRVGKGGGGCSGCPRDPNMLCDDPPKCTICWCFAEMGAQLNNAGGAELALATGGACVEERKPVLSPPAGTK